MKLGKKGGKVLRCKGLNIDDLVGGKSRGQRFRRGSGAGRGWGLGRRYQTDLSAPTVAEDL